MFPDDRPTRHAVRLGGLDVPLVDRFEYGCARNPEFAPHRRRPKHHRRGQHLFDGREEAGRRRQTRQVGRAGHGGRHEELAPVEPQQRVRLREHR
ncbi:hypothetical protein BN903_328 [Halorubrum sp. AJ67]|nr:hypothetical protein BN903_328 [Halorubrum sp. AJ67]